MSNLSTQSGAHEECDTTGTHGMLLFGDQEALYLSHLPMFTSPHNFQVILEVGFDDAIRNTFLSDHQADGKTIHTFVPEPFPIVDLRDRGFGNGPARTSLRGTIFHGHFERGGKPIAEDVVATVRDVVYFVELDITEKHGEDWGLSYQCFGHPGRLYFAHTIGTRPNFDHIVSARMIPGTVTNPMGDLTGADVSAIGYDRTQEVTFSKRPDTPQDRLTPGEVTRAGFLATFGPPPVESHGFFVQIGVENELYFETNDLT
ncbi:MAG TPA: hypothetical protein VF458_07230 [Ktedonobacteraceae bacterium]